MEAEGAKLRKVDVRLVGKCADLSGVAVVAPTPAEWDGVRLEPASMVSESWRASPSVISSKSSAEVRRGAWREEPVVTVAGEEAEVEAVAEAAWKDCDGLSSGRRRLRASCSGSATGIC